MSVIERCWRCHGTGEMDLDRGQTSEYVACTRCKGTGKFQERRARTRRSSDQGAVEDRVALLTLMREAAAMDPPTCRKWIKRAVEGRQA